MRLVRFSPWLQILETDPYLRTYLGLAGKKLLSGTQVVKTL
jgi:hypothetical protein